MGKPAYTFKLPLFRKLSQIDYGWVVDADNKLVAEAYAFGDNAIAIADLIVRAVNAHDALLAFAKLCTAFLESVSLPPNNQVVRHQTAELLESGLLAIDAAQPAAETSKSGAEPHA